MPHLFKRIWAALFSSSKKDHEDVVPRDAGEAKMKHISRNNHRIDERSKDSFPASDPPGWY